MPSADSGRRNAAVWNSVTAAREAAGRMFNTLPASVSIDYNLLYNVGSTAVYGSHLAYVAGVGNLDTLDAFRAATGYEVHGRFGDPAFLNAGGGDLRIGSGSPAVDGGAVILGDGYRGSAPDMGRFEAP